MYYERANDQNSKSLGIKMLFLTNRCLDDWLRLKMGLGTKIINRSEIFHTNLACINNTMCVVRNSRCH